MKHESDSGKLTAAYITLGCKVNQYETEKIRYSLEQLGFVSVPANTVADLYIINTCTVTSAADSKSRAHIRRVIRRNPDALIVVTGCYSQLEPLAVSSIEGVDIVVSNPEKGEIADIVSARLNLRYKPDCELRSSAKRLRTRAVVKVQDGCDNFCSYCVIPYARPVMSSRKLENVLGEIAELIDSGFQEIILTGIRLGAYNDNGKQIADLVRESARLPGIGRIRLSSIEPWEISDPLLDAMQDSCICRHLHIPLQSGDDSILKKMNRRYDTKTYLGMLAHVREMLPGIGITTDIIVGFPGEDDAAFSNSLKVVREAGFARMHVFRYSPRKLTHAADIPHQVSKQAKKVRAEKMENLASESTRKFATSWVGEVLPVLFETKSAEDGFMRGYSDNYIEVKTARCNNMKNKIINMRITHVDDSGVLFGEPIDAQKGIL